MQIEMNWGQRVCNVFTKEHMKTFMKFVKTLKGDPNSSKINSFDYLNLTQQTNVITNAINNRMKEWGIFVVTENNTSFGIFKNNRVKGCSLVLLNRLADSKQLFEHQGFQNISYYDGEFSKNVFLDDTNGKRILQIKFMAAWETIAAM